MALLEKLLIANRGEIALRIIKSAKLLGIRTVAIYTESSKEAEYVRLADESVTLGRDDLNSTFLNIKRIIDIAIATGSSAIHPGYGFLAENPDFALACLEHKLLFIGPEADVIRLMGNKPEAKKLAFSLGIPVVSGHRFDLSSDLPHKQIAFPALIKASYGGGGKGMKIVNNQEELDDQAKQSSRIAMKYFGNGELFVEQYIRNARHVEVQIIGDKFGNIIHLYERECSIQRNHQKIIEEAPAIFLSPELRGKLLSAALKIGKSVKYSGAGTVEFLVDENGNYFFMEMNPRIQVEHAVTEQITGIDIVSEQLKIAAGLPLSISQEQVIISGHAMEVRIYTENPAENFRPSSHQLLSINLPEHPNLRIEADLAGQYQANNQFDPLLLKLIARGEDRGSACNLLYNGLSNLNIIGPENNAKYLEMILAHDQFKQNDLSVEFCQTNHSQLVRYAEEKTNFPQLPWFLGLAIKKCFLEVEKATVSDPWKYTGYWRLTTQNVPISMDNEIFKVGLNINDKSRLSFVLNGTTIGFEATENTVHSANITISHETREIFYHIDSQGDISISLDNVQHRMAFPGWIKNEPQTGIHSVNRFQNDSTEIISPLHGKIIEIYINENQFIKKGDPLLVIEAMKSENHILSHRDAKVKKIAVKVGAQVTDRMPLIYLEE